jgi:hypothetical protein
MECKTQKLLPRHHSCIRIGTSADFSEATGTPEPKSKSARAAISSQAENIYRA